MFFNNHGYKSERFKNWKTNMDTIVFKKWEIPIQTASGVAKL